MNALVEFLSLDSGEISERAESLTPDQRQSLARLLVSQPSKLDMRSVDHFASRVMKLLYATGGDAESGRAPGNFMLDGSSSSNQDAFPHNMLVQFESIMRKLKEALDRIASAGDAGSGAKPK